MTSSPSTLLPPVLGSIVGGVIGAMATYWLNLRPTQTKDKVRNTTSKASDIFHKHVSDIAD